MYLKPIITSLLFTVLLVKTFALKPIKEYSVSPTDWGITFEENNININNEGDYIKSWLLKPTENRQNKTILFCYGDYGNMSYSLLYGAKLYELGYDVIMFDYRGFGESYNFAIDTNQLYYEEFVQDLEFVNKFYSSNDYQKQPIIFMGLSMGSIVITRYFDKMNLKKQTFIFDGFVHSFENVIKYSTKSTVPKIPINNKSYKKSIKKLKSQNGLIFVGTEDKTCAVDNITRKRFEVVDYNGKHLQSLFMLTKGEETGNVYFEKINQFVKNDNDN